MSEIISPDVNRADRIPPGQRETDRWPVLHSGHVQMIDTARWSLRIWGEVEQEKALSYDEFLSLPMETVISDIHCVTRWSRLNNRWEGVGTAALKDVVELKPGANFVIVHAAPDFTTNLPAEDFFQDDVLLATAHDGEPISAEHGGPVRLVVPRLYFWKSAKWVTGIEFVDRDRPGFWESMGYHSHGDPWKEERYEHAPRW